MANFKFSKLWEEMVQHHCFLKDIFNAISGNLIDFTENKESLKIKHSFGPNKTIQSISKVCRAVSGIKEVTENFDVSSNIHQSSMQHTIRNANVDEEEMIK